MYSDQKSLHKNPKTFISFADPYSLQSSHLLQRHYRNNDTRKRQVEGIWDVSSKTCRHSWQKQIKNMRTFLRQSLLHLITGGIYYLLTYLLTPWSRVLL